MAVYDLNRAKFPPEVVAWLEEQATRPDRQEGTEETLQKFINGLEDGDFATKQMISEKVTARVNEVFKRGRHTKMLSKKMRQKIHGKAYVTHLPLKKTALFTQIKAEKRKSCGFTFTVVNYFETDQGFVYALRFGDSKPHIFMFTGHVFDRILTRQMSNKDHAAKMQAVFRLMRYMNHSSDRMPIITFGNQAYMKALGGICVGVTHSYRTLPPVLDFETKLQPETGPRDVFFFMTYISKEMLRPEQLYIYDHMLVEAPDLELFGNEIVVDK